MIKVAFWFDRPQEYTGGLNYLRNLLFALSQLEDNKLQPYIYFGTKVDDAVVRSFEPLAIVVRTTVLDRKSPAWFAHKVLQKVFGSLLMVDFTIRRRGISIVSHAEHVYGHSRRFKVISWIPDFQYLHLPELFPGLDTAAESERMRSMAAQTDALILSSHAALADYRRIADASNPLRPYVLQFVSQPTTTSTDSVTSRADLESKYGFEGRFFFLPNQFWQHKNHTIAFAAVKALKDQRHPVLLLCTGNLVDYRLKGTSYLDGLRNYLDDHKLYASIRILGAIPYADVLSLMRHSVAVINPSRFEGWSSTVEEAKSMGKRLVLSDIPVHREQAPHHAAFFKPDDTQALVRAMADHWQHPSDAINDRDAEQAHQDLLRRTATYANSYTSIVLDLERRASGMTEPAGSQRSHDLSS